mgnify:CR=1 FL=1
MSEEEKKRKEALAAIIDGLDILVGIEKEKTKEEKEKPADTFGGLLQSMIPLMIIPQLLPLFQQGLGQTLRETTVNVKVESATAIIPIDIAAQTAILAVDIRAQSVTLNIRIIEATTTINVTVTNAVLTVQVTGDANIIIKGQTVGVSLEGTFATLFGNELDLIGVTTVPPFGKGVIISYSPPPSPMVAMIEGIHASYFLFRDTVMRPDLVIVAIKIGYDEIAWLNLSWEKSSDTLSLLRAVRVDGPMEVIVYNRSPVTIRVKATAFIYEVTP